MAGTAHFGGKCIEAGCVDGIRIPVKKWTKIRLGEGKELVFRETSNNRDIWLIKQGSTSSKLFLNGDNDRSKESKLRLKVCI